jgi:hypothetical protein
MQVSRHTDGMIEIDVTSQELGWLAQSLNECCGGFRMTDFKSQIGVEKPEVMQLLDQILSMYPERR